MAYADLWGLNPQTGRLYTVPERRAAMDSMGTPARPNIAGPLPSMMWDDWFTRANNAGQPEDFNAFNYGRPGSKGWNQIHQGLVSAASKKEATGEASGKGWGSGYNPAASPQSTFNTNQVGSSPWGQAKGNMPGGQVKGNMPGIQAGTPLMTQQDPYEGVPTNKMINMSKGGAPTAALNALKRYR